MSIDILDILSPHRPFAFAEGPIPPPPEEGMVKQIDVRGSNAEENLNLAVPFDSTDRATGTDNADLVKTLAGDPLRPIILSQIHCGYLASGSVSGTLEVKDGTTVVWKMPINSAEPFTFDFVPARTGTPGLDMVITLSAGGSGTVGYLNPNARKHT